MKKWIHASVDNHKYADCIIDNIRRSDLAELVDIATVYDKNYPDSPVEVALKDGYYAKYYPRWKEYVGIVIIAPSRDWVTSGSPEKYVVINESRVDDTNYVLQQLNKLAQSILEVSAKAADQ